MLGRLLSVAVVGCILFTVAGCPLFRPSAKPEEACQAAARVTTRCGATPAEKWDQARTSACMATLHALNAAQSTDKGFTAARMRDCESGELDCAAAMTCVKDNLAYAAKHSKPTTATPK